MRKRIMSILVALALALPVNTLAAASKSPKLAKCNGKERRPANPYGTILPTVDPLAGTSSPAQTEQDQERESGSVNVFSEPAPAPPKAARPADKPVRQVPPISSAGPPTSYRSC